MKPHPTPDRILLELPPGMWADALDDYNERAAVFEYDGGMTREAAEAAAIKLVMERYLARIELANSPDIKSVTVRR